MASGFTRGRPRKGRRSGALRYSLRTLLLAVALLAAVLGAGRWCYEWYYETYYLVRPIVPTALTQRALEDQLSRGRVVVVTVECPVGSCSARTIIRRAMDTASVRRLVHRHRIGVLMPWRINVPPSEDGGKFLESLLESVHVRYPFALVYNPRDGRRRIVVTDFSSDKPIRDAIRQSLRE
jgi:hypothetical protein